VGPVQSFHEICAFSNADMRFQALISAAYIIGTAALIGESVCRVVAIDLLPEPAVVSPLEGVTSAGVTCIQGICGRDPAD
jgi:hypothetical protein